MNKVFRVIWNKSTQTWVAVSELAKGRVKSSSSNSTGTKLLSTIFKLSQLALLSSFALTANMVYADTSQTSGSKYRVTDTFGRPIGANISSPGEYAVRGIGSKSVLDNATTAYGTGSNAVGSVSVAYGVLATAQGASAVAIGSQAYAVGANSLAVMRNSSAGGDHSLAIGAVAYAEGGGSMAMGHSAHSKGKRSIAIGATEDSVTNKNNKYRTDNNTQTLADRAIAIGATARTGENAADAIAFGTSTNVNNKNGVAIGNNASVTGNDSVAIGNGSTASDEAAVTNLKFKNAGGTATDQAFNAKNAASSVFSVGSSGNLRQIQNVGNGRVTADSTDAVNGGQLYTVMTNVGFNVKGPTGYVARVNNDNEVTFGNSTYITAEVTGANPTIKFTPVLQGITSTAATKATATGNTAGLATTAEVVKAINNAGFKLKSSGLPAGSNVINGGEVMVSQGKNINVAQTGTTLTISTVDSPTFTTLTTTGVATIGGKLSAKGIDAGGKINNVTAGSADTDAVNVKQLKDEVAKAGGSWNLGVGTKTSTINTTNPTATFASGSNLDVALTGSTVTLFSKTKPNLYWHGDREWF